jgi:hypothetical protein
MSCNISSRSALKPHKVLLHKYQPDLSSSFHVPHGHHTYLRFVKCRGQNSHYGACIFRRYHPFALPPSLPDQECTQRTQQGPQHIQILSIKQRCPPINISTCFAQPVLRAAPRPEHNSSIAQPHFVSLAARHASPFLHTPSASPFRRNGTDEERWRRRWRWETPV